MCWRDISTAIFTMSTYASPDMFVNHVTFSFSQFITYLSLGSVSLDRNPSLLHDKYVSSVKLITVWISCPLLWCVTLSRSHQRQPYLMNRNGGWWNRHRFRYFAMILLQCTDYNGILRMGEPPSIQRHCPLVQAHNLSLHHLHYLPNESVHAGCPIILCMGLHLAD